MINVLIVDDSAFMRQMFRGFINEHPNMTVVKTARNGIDAIEKIERYSPDVVTLDIEMPKKNGLETLKELKNKKNFKIPIIMVSALDNRETVMDALELGAFDFLSKPSSKVSVDIDDIKEDLIRKIEAAYNSNKSFSYESTNPIIRKTKKFKMSEDFPVVAIGSSSGGPKALRELLHAFPEDFPGAVILVQHMPEGFIKPLAVRLDTISNLNIKAAEEGDRLKPGNALIAPGGFHLEIINEKVSLNKKAKKWGVRPAVDYMMNSVAKLYSNRVIGVILTGMGHDGGEGMHSIKANGGYCIVQDEQTSLVYGMPQSAIDKNAYDEICPLGEIAYKIVDVIERKF